MDDIVKIFQAILTFAVATLSSGLVVLCLWNWIVPDVFGLPHLTFWQAVGMNVLCGMLFGPTARIKTRINKKPKQTI